MSWVLFQEGLPAFPSLDLGLQDIWVHLNHFSHTSTLIVTNALALMLQCPELQSWCTVARWMP